MHPLCCCSLEGLGLFLTLFRSGIRASICISLNTRVAPRGDQHWVATKLERSLRKELGAMTDTGASNYIELTADIVSAYVSNNSVAATDMSSLINQVHQALIRVGGGYADGAAEPP